MALFTALSIIWGGWAVKTIPLDAIPDLSDTQVVIYAKWMKSPDILEDQVAYPMVQALLGAPKVKSIRAFSDFGFTYVYVIFEDGTDLYWARSRVLEYLSKIQGALPEGVQWELGPDATSVGWVYQYALVDRSGRHDLSDLRSYQDFTLKYILQSLPGVAEVSSVGGIPRQYQVDVNPNALAAFGLSLRDIIRAVRESNRDVGGGLMQVSGTEYMVRGLGYAKSIEDLERIVVGRDVEGTPVLLRDVATVHFGSSFRRGIAELDGEGEVVGGIVTARFGENALDVIRRVKAKIEEIRPMLPEGVELVAVYDRSELILESISTLTHELIKLSVAVTLVCLLFLWHLPSAFLIILTLPVAVLISFICMQALGVSSNIMSLGGIAIAIGTMVDASIIIVENAVKRLEEWERSGKKESRTQVLTHAAQEVGPALFFSLLVITVSFLPVFALQGQEGRLFHPLAYTKTFSMLFASIVAVTLVPMLLPFFLRGKITPEEKHPVSRFLHRLYEPAAAWTLANRGKVFLFAAGVVLSTLIPWNRLGKEFMPPLWEGDLLYMPTTLPGVSASEVARVLQMQDRVLAAFPEVERVFGKAGRADTPLDPAPLSMVETVILLKPKEHWRPGMTKEKLVQELNQALQVPGWTNAWTYPIKTRLDMLSTGVRTPLGIKVLGPNLQVIEKVGLDIEAVLQSLPGTRSVLADRVSGGYYLDVAVNREEAARFGLTVEDVNMVLEHALGAEVVTTTVEGRERYGVVVRYAWDFRDDPEKFARLPIRTPQGTYIQLGQVVEIRKRQGPGMIRDENGFLASYVFVDFEDGVDPGGYVEAAKKHVAERVKIPPGVTLLWSGQYEYMVRAAERLVFMVPLTLLLVFLLIYFNTRSVTETTIILLAVPFSVAGAAWLLYLLDYNLSVAVWVGIIALAGLDAETGVVMMLYLNLAYKKWKAKGRLRSLDDLKAVAMEGAVQRVRPKMMTVGTLWIGLIPLMLSSGVGSDVMKRIAAPMVGGVFTSFLLELLVYPALFTAWKWHSEVQPELEGRAPRGFWKWVRKIG